MALNVQQFSIVYLMACMRCKWGDGLGAEHLLTNRFSAVLASPGANFAHFSIFFSIYRGVGVTGVRVTLKMGSTRPPTVTMGPPYSFKAHKVVFALFLRTSTNQRKLVKLFNFYYFPKVKWVWRFQIWSLVQTKNF